MGYADSYTHNEKNNHNDIHHQKNHKHHNHNKPIARRHSCNRPAGLLQIIQVVSRSRNSALLYKILIIQLASNRKKPFEIQNQFTF